MARSGAAHGTGSSVSRALAGVSSYSRSTSRFPTLDAEQRFINALLEDRDERYGLARRAVSTGAGRMALGSIQPDDRPARRLHSCASRGSRWPRLGRHAIRRSSELATHASRRPPTVTRAYNHGNGFTADWIFAVNELEDGRLWVGTNTGLAEFSGRRPEARQALARVRQGQRVHLSRDCRRFGGPRRQHLARDRQRRDEAGPKRLSVVRPGGRHRDRDAAVRARPA